MGYVLRSHRDVHPLDPGETENNMPSKNEILAALGAIIDPDFQQDIVSLGFVKDLQVQAGEVSFTIELTSPACSVKEQFRSQAERSVGGLSPR